MSLPTTHEASSKAQSGLKNLLRQYYSSRETEQHPLDYNSMTFDADAYFQKLLKEKHTKELIQLDLDLGMGKVILYYEQELWLERLLIKYDSRYSKARRGIEKLGL
jgi:hypothetical protein